MLGDSAYVIIDEKDKIKLTQYGQRICNAAKMIHIPELDCGITASAGIALWADHGVDSRSLLENADRALYEAKKNGKNQYIMFRQGMADGIRAKGELECEKPEG